MEKIEINYEETCKECGHNGILVMQCYDCDCDELCKGNIEKFCFKCEKQYTEPVPPAM